jgi:hypothetical protein
MSALRRTKAWYIDRSEDTKIKDADGNTVLWTAHTRLRGRCTDEEVMAVAHLASAAPDLLEALVWAEAVLAPFSTSPAEKSGINLIRAAIAKANGDAS